MNTFYRRSALVGLLAVGFIASALVGCDSPPPPPTEPSPPMPKAEMNPKAPKAVRSIKDRSQQPPAKETAKEKE